MFSHEGYQALRATAGLTARTDRGLLAVTGAERLDWLQGLLTNDVKGLGPGAACYAAYLTPQGRMISDMHVVALEDRVLLDVPDRVAQGLRDRLDGLVFAEDVQVQDVSSATVGLELHGPTAPQVIGRALIAPGDPGEPAVVREDRIGLPGYGVYVARAHQASITDRLVQAGATLVSQETLDVVRVEEGVPAFGADMDEDTIPLEAGIEGRAISFTKGCYVGQEVIVRVTTRGGGRVARRLVGLVFGEADGVQAGDRLVAPGEEPRDIGRVTSVVWSPALGRVIGLGYLHRDFVEPGTTVAARTGDRQITAEVAKLPFVHTS